MEHNGPELSLIGVHNGEKFGVLLKSIIGTYFEKHNRLRPTTR